MILYAHKYYNMLIYDDLVLAASINNIKNSDKYEIADEKEEDENEDDDIYMDPLDNIS